MRYNMRRLDSSNERFNDLSDRNAHIYLHLVKAVFTGWNFKTAQSAVTLWRLEVHQDILEQKLSNLSAGAGAENTELTLTVLIN